MKLKLDLLIAFLCISILLQGQETIELVNPSLEDISRAGQVYGFAPKGWKDCSPENQTSVDIQPGHFSVFTTPKDGKSYVGMVARNSQTWEGISQKLQTPLLKGQKYEITFHLAKSNDYLSPTPGSRKMQRFSNPLQLRVYGANDYCGNTTLLARSPIIEHDDWQAYTLAFEAPEEFTFIKLEGFYQTPTLMPYNGNLLIDDISNIIPISKYTKKHITLNSEILNKKASINMDTSVEEIPQNDRSNSNTGITPEKIAPKKYVPPAGQKRFKPTQSDSQYIPRPKSQSLVNGEIIDNYLKELRIRPEKYPADAKSTVGLILNFIKITEKFGWVNYVENHTFEINRYTAQKLIEIRAYDAGWFLRDYANTMKLNDPEKNKAPRKITAR